MAASDFQSDVTVLCSDIARRWQDARPQRQADWHRFFLSWEANRPEREKVVKAMGVSYRKALRDVQITIENMKSSRENSRRGP